MSATLYLVATPLGNAQDLSPRAREVLERVDLIYCEDTRTSSRLFSYLGLQVSTLRSLHAHNEAERRPEILAALKEGKELAIVSDAGTPAISDPGALVVEAALEEGLRVSPIPGACAVSTLMSAAGLPGAHYLFLGFLPKNKGARRKILEARLQAGAVLVFYMPMRDLPTVAREIERLAPSALCVLGRELTKIHEEVLRLEAGPFAEELESRERLLGEATVVVALPEDSENALSPGKVEAIEQAWARLLDGGFTRRDAREIVVGLTGLSKSRVKKILQDP